jgi:CheY-like chemotaxis protein
LTAGSAFVAVIDDDAMNRLCCPEASSETGSACGRWRIGQAQGALRDERLDCAPLDVLMPDLDGYQVLEHIRSDPSHSGTRR